MQLQELLEKPLDELTDDELEAKIHVLKKLRVMQEEDSTSLGPAKAKVRHIKSNKDRQMDDLLGGLSKEELNELEAILVKKKIEGD